MAIKVSVFGAEKESDEYNAALKLTVDKDHKGNIVTDEIGLPVEGKDIILPCGIFARWESVPYED